MTRQYNSGTVLLVEDHPGLRKLVKQVLQDAGFTVIPASTATEALQIEAQFPGTIDILLTDVRMPRMSGPKLAVRLRAQRPQMRVALMSGYPGGALRVVSSGWHYIEKPFAPSTLVRRLRNILVYQRQEPFERVPLARRTA